MTEKNAFGLVKYSPKAIFTHPKMTAAVRAMLDNWFDVLDIDKKDAKELVEHTIESCKRSTVCGEDLELELIGHYERLNVIDIMNQKLVGRADLIFSYTQHYIPANASILDIGAGTGTIAKRFHDAGYNIIMHDIKGDGTEKRVPAVVDSGIPYDLHDNDEPLKYESNKFDMSLLNCVMHHCDNPMAVLDEAIRVTGKRIAILESVYGVTREEISDKVYEQNPKMYDLFFSLGKEEQKKYGTFLDWFLNKASFRNNAYVPFNFNTPENWEKIFAEKGLNVIAKKIVGIDQPVTPEFHIFYVVEKIQNDKS